MDVMRDLKCNPDKVIVDVIVDNPVARQVAHAQARARMQVAEDLKAVYDEASLAVGNYGLDAVLAACDLRLGCGWTEIEPDLWARKTSAGKLCFDETLDAMSAEIDNEILMELEAEAQEMEEDNPFPIHDPVLGGFITEEIDKEILDDIRRVASPLPKS